MSEWEIVRDKEDRVRRMKVHDGYLYQVQRGRCYIGHPSNGNWEPMWHPPVFVPDGASLFPLVRPRENQ